MIPAPSIFLVGLMGAGKTTVGKLLAKSRQMEFIDADHTIVERCGVPIPTIFELEGEEGFRRREAAVIDELSQRPGIVLATGGGAVLRADNREHLKSRGTVIYLCCQPHELYVRTRHDKNRPLLQTGDPLRKLQELFAIRHPLYGEIADLTIESGRQNVHCLVRRLEDQLSALMAGACPPPERECCQDASPADAQPAPTSAPAAATMPPDTGPGPSH